jgi:hypothetical protein
VLKSFPDYINEALTLRRAGGEHYLERVQTRLTQLEVVGFTNNNGEKIDAKNSDILQTQQFFREILPILGDPDKSRVFADTTVEPGYIGLVRLGKPTVTLSTGEEVLPIFKVYERTDDSTGKSVFRKGTCFWLFTIGSQVSTIKLYNMDGTSKSEKSFLVNKSIDHMMADRAAELAKISRVFSIGLDSRKDLEKRHTIVLNPGEITKLHLDLQSGDLKEQASEILNRSTVSKPDPTLLDPDRESTFSLESVPKQMNVTPNKVWLLEKNEKFNTWGALPIIQSKQIPVLNGNAIEIKVGRKWLHWLKEPVFNTPLQIDRVIKKGDTITLAKQMGNGNWLINTGTITDISTDSTSSEYPYVKTNGWAESSVMPSAEASKIFKDSRVVAESFTNVLSFSQWNSIN